MQKWGWGLVSVALLIFVTTYQNQRSFSLFSLILLIIGIVMIVKGTKKEKQSEDYKDN